VTSTKSRSEQSRLIPAQILVTLLACTLLSGEADAQGRTIPLPSGQRRGVIGRSAPTPPPRAVGVIAIEPYDLPRPVTGVPYTAQAITETTQLSTDGRRLEQRTTAAVARDNAGRTRREQQPNVLGVAGSQAPLVIIEDPTTRTHVTLDAERHVAVRRRMAVAVAREDAPISAAVRPGFGRSDEASAGGNVRRETLGEKVIEGVRAEGIRTTMTIAADAVDGQPATPVVSERWYSPQLQVVVRTLRSDPRFGETVYRLSNIVLGEPPAHLFKVPFDYRIEEQTISPPLRPQ
jgi:hypothetical protein